MSLENPVPSARQSLETENFIDTYKVIAEWIRFADAKAGVTLTVNGILLGLLVPTLKPYLDAPVTHPTGWWPTLVLVVFLIWLGLLAVSAINSFLCILPLRGKSRRLALERAAHFHPAAISQHYPVADPDRFVAACRKIGPEGLKEEVMAAILIDSHLSSSKYRFVANSIWFLAGNVCFAFLYLFAIQF
ncbi:MAG: hypothetical protein U0793_27160 [Gemmataceae bacterium]